MIAQYGPLKWVGKIMPFTGVHAMQQLQCACQQDGTYFRSTGVILTGGPSCYQCLQNFRSGSTRI